MEVKTNPFTYIKSINEGKDLTKTLGDDFTEYVPFVTNKSFSFHVDTIMYANEMNLSWNLTPKQQYKYYLNSVSPKKRYGWIKDEKSEELSMIQRLYKVNRTRARSILKVLTDEQLEYLRTIKTGE